MVFCFMTRNFLLAALGQAVAAAILPSVDENGRQSNRPAKI
jgi:hypothetical protein